MCVKNRLDRVQEGGELNFKNFHKTGSDLRMRMNYLYEVNYLHSSGLSRNNSVNRCSEYTAEVLQIQSNSLVNSSRIRIQSTK